MRYESLVTDPGPVGDRILDLLSVQDPAERARFREALGQLRGASIGRWREHLDDADLALLDREAGSLLHRCAWEPAP